MITKIKIAWSNAYYRGIGLYVAIIVTLIFGFQMYRYFYAVPAGTIKCKGLSLSSLIPVIGVLFNG